MDEEASFANLLSSTSSAPKPSWSTTAADDPWANPFSDTTSSNLNPFAAAPPSLSLSPSPSTSPFPSTSQSTFDIIPSSNTFGIGIDPDSPRETQSPYVQQLERDVDQGRGILPDPPSVIAAREAQSPYDSGVMGRGGYQEYDNFNTSPPLAQDSYVARQATPPPPPSKELPPGLIDEDLLAENDPSVSLKKAFVKSSASPAKHTEGAAKVERYVFRPSPKTEQKTEPKDKKEAKEKEKTAVKEEAQVKAEVPEKQAQQENKEAKVESKQDGEVVAEPKDVKGDDSKSSEEVSQPTSTQQAAPETQTPTTTASLAPAAIPLPTSSDVTPTATRSATPVPPALLPSNDATSPQPEPSQPNPSTVAATPIGDRVAVSPLDAPSAEADYGFKSLSIGAASASLPRPPPLPAKDNVDAWTAGSGNDQSPSVSRFSGKGWGAVDEDDDANGGLFGKGGPPVKGDPWGGNDSGGWGEAEIPSTPASAGPSYNTTASSSTTTPSRDPQPLPPIEAVTADAHRTKTKPMFQIAVGDPTRMGDPVRGYTVYTVRTRTTSPHYRKSEFSVLRRFSDFLWLFDALTLNNPGVIVPPVPDKHPFGRFQDQFIETRRQALERCLNKVTSHPVLQLDLDLRLFLESDSFAIESKNRRLETPADKAGLLAGWTGPRFVEQDDWFDSRRTFLDSLESQLKSLSKSIEGASKTRLDLGVAMGDVVDSMASLAESDLGTAMCAALSRLSDLARQERETNEDQAKSDVVHLLNLADEYVRFIASVRVAFASRIKSYHASQAAEKEVARLKSQREKLRQQGKLGDRAQQSLVEVNEAERRARETSLEFEQISRLVKSEFARFERERVQEFKRVLEIHLADQIKKQKELIEAWEDYHAVVLKMVQKSQQGQGQGQRQGVRA
ncbi:Vps5 C terminal like-domain-containing protein [Naematelia encephala]|uniref:Vps5 C terminal like-domain-containing protein n=1 Tax=Naematelia encephala TaxID=71784 RepID=A0A1Y2ATT6_9TREE|nr:Vps5 C terminal like-domain-containing protein [Naematelia encephala]